MLFSPCLVLGLAALPMCAPNPLISCGQEFLSKGNVGKVEGGKVTSEKSSYIFSFHISCSKEFLYKGNIWGFSSHFLCTGIPYHRKYGRRWCYYFFQNSPFLPPLFSHFLWTGIPDRRKCEDQETTVRHLNNCPHSFRGNLNLKLESDMTTTQITVAATITTQQLKLMKDLCIK